MAAVMAALPSPRFAFHSPLITSSAVLPSANRTRTPSAPTANTSARPYWLGSTSDSHNGYRPSVASCTKPVASICASFISISHSVRVGHSLGRPQVSPPEGREQQPAGDRGQRDRENRVPQTDVLPQHPRDVRTDRERAVREHAIGGRRPADHVETDHRLPERDDVHVVDGQAESVHA